MTVCAAYYFSARDYALATDSHGVVDGLRVPVRKAVRVGRCIVAHTGTLSQFQRAIDWLGNREWGDDADRGWVAATLRAMHEALVDANGPRESGREPTIETVFLVVGPAGIVVMDTAGALVWHTPCFAVGAGERFALGAMFARDRWGATMDPADTVRGAVEAALRWSCDCHGEAVVLAAEGA